MPSGMQEEVVCIPWERIMRKSYVVRDCGLLRLVFFSFLNSGKNENWADYLHWRCPVTMRQLSRYILPISCWSIAIVQVAISYSFVRERAVTYHKGWDGFLFKKKKMTVVMDIWCVRFVVKLGGLHNLNASEMTQQTRPLSPNLLYRGVVNVREAIFLFSFFRTVLSLIVITLTVYPSTQQSSVSDRVEVVRDWHITPSCPHANHKVLP